MNQNSQAPTQQRFDPARVTEAAAAGTPFELVLLFHRTVFMPTTEGFVPEVIGSAAVAMSWEVAKQVRSLIDQQIANHEENFGEIKEKEAARLRPN